MTWSAKQYSTFEQERTRPVRDLVAAIAAPSVRLAADLGCGPGNSTEVLAQRYPEARIIGVDNDDDMLAAARARMPDTRFDRADIATWQPDEPQDLILANASLQWLPDHNVLYPKLAGLLASGGCLAVQTPDNMNEPAHTLARSIAASPPFAATLAHVRHPARHDPAYYFALLKPHCRQVDVWRTTYFHPMPGGAQAVVEWFKGSALRPYLSRLDDAERAAFLERYRKEVALAYPALEDGTVLLPFPRLFIVATR